MIALLVVSTTTEGASLLDPALRFRTLATAHFRIHFHRREERLALRLSTIAEDAWTRVGAAMGVSAPRMTHVILADQTELANGWATPIPYNTIFVTAAAPAGHEYIGNETDWLRLVFTHEFTHIVHLDRSEGWARVFRGVLGRTPIAFPNLWLPGWQIEGLATWEESALTPGREGRRYAGDFRAIERESARAHRVEPLDRVNGGLSDWPGGLAPYAYGLGFHEFLVDRYGEATLGQLAEQTARRLPFLGAFAFGEIYNRPLPDLWRDYSEWVVERTPAARPASGPAPSRLTELGYTIAAPRFAPPTCAGCSSDIVFSRQDPHGFPQLSVFHQNSRQVEQLTSRYLGETTGVSRDWLVFDQQELRRNTAVLSDLYAYDRRTGATHRLTTTRRLQDPDLSPDGTTIVCVSEHEGQRDLVLVRLRSGTTEPGAAPVVDRIVTLVAETGVRFNTPRWSPDGRTLAAVRQRPGALAELVVVDPDTRDVRVVSSRPDARIVTPAWTPAGQSIVAAATFDGGPFNLYEFRVSDGAFRSVTTTSGGALWPDISPDGNPLLFVGYTTSGFDLFTLPFDSLEAGFGAPPPRVMPTPDISVEATPGSLGSPYRPWSTLPPTTWYPLLVNDNDAFRLGAAVSGGDVLGRHAYYASATWLLDARAASFVPDRAIPDWDVAYVYDRWRPTLFASASSETLFRQGTPENGRPTELTVREREIEAGVQIPVRHVRVSQVALASVIRTTDDFLFPIDRATRRRVASRFGYSVSSSHEFGYSISPEKGVTFGTTAEVSRRSLGASANVTTATADLRAYLPGLAEHHVVALRAGGGASSGPSGATRIFLLGGGNADESTLDFGSGAFSLLRGFPSDSFAGSRVAVVNADYRWPIARPQRGVNVWPFFLHSIHAAATFDAANAWTGGSTLADVKTSAGGELSFDLVVGYSFPVTATFGAAWGRDGATGDRGATGYVRIGHAF